MSTGTEGKSILIFGAGLNQLELIREARRLGLVTVVIDPQPEPPGKSEADFFYSVDGGDYDATRRVAVKHKVSGIITGQMEKPLRLMAALADDLDLIFNSPEVTERSTDKWLMKQAFIAAGVPCAKGMLISRNEELELKLKTVPAFPVIIKPRDAYSSRGVFRCSSAEEVISCAGISRSYSTNGDILLEEFIEGSEYSIEAITFRGETTIVQFTEKFITPYPRTVETGHLQPAALSDEARKSISRSVIRAIKALGIENSASHTEVKLSAKGPIVIETGARLGGDFIASYLTKASTGVSMDRAAIQVALGNKPDLEHRTDSYSMIRYFELPAGKVIKNILPINDIVNHSGVVMACLFVSPGEKTRPITHSAQRPGCVIVKAESREEVLSLEKEMSNRLVSKIIL